MRRPIKRHTRSIQTMGKRSLGSCASVTSCALQHSYRAQLADLGAHDRCLHCIHTLDAPILALCDQSMRVAVRAVQRQSSKCIVVCHALLLLLEAITSVNCVGRSMCTMSGWQPAASAWYKFGQV